MKAGKLKHRVAFDEPTVSKNETGEEVVTFAEAFTLWAAIEPLRGRERLVANQVLADMDARLRVRWSPQAARITAKWRARHGAAIYNITAPPAEVMTAHRELEITVAAGANEGG